MTAGRSKSTARKPEFILSIKAPDGGKCRVGAAWWSDDKSYLTMRLNPGVVLDWKAIDGCALTLFPNDVGSGERT